MRQDAWARGPRLWLAGIVLLLAGAIVTSCTTAGPPASHAQGAAPASTPTARPLHQNYVYLDDALLLDGSPNATQAHAGQTLSIGWSAHAYNQSADPSPVTLSLLVYGPFASRAALSQTMGIGGPGTTPTPVSRLALTPVASAPMIRADTWTTAPQTTTFQIPASLQPGLYDVVLLSTDGPDTVMRGDSPLRIG